MWFRTVVKVDVAGWFVARRNPKVELEIKIWGGLPSLELDLRRLGPLHSLMRRKHCTTEIRPSRYIFVLSIIRYNFAISASCLFSLTPTRSF